MERSVELATDAPGQQTARAAGGPRVSLEAAPGLSCTACDRGRAIGTQLSCAQIPGPQKLYESKRLRWKPLHCGVLCSAATDQ